MKYIFKNTEIAYWWPDIEFKRKSPKVISLPDHSRKPRAQTKGSQPPFYATKTNLPVGCAFRGSEG